MRTALSNTLGSDPWKMAVIGASEGNGKASSLDPDVDVGGMYRKCPPLLPNPRYLRPEECSPTDWFC